MESGSGRGALTDGPQDSSSQKPKLEGLNISSPPFDMPGHFHSGLYPPLPGPLGGDGIRMHDAGIRMHVSPEGTNPDWNPGH